jgi:hypothetical protein
VQPVGQEFMGVQVPVRRIVFSEFWKLLRALNLSALHIFLKLLTLSILHGKNTSAEARLFQRILRIPRSSTKWQFAKFALENLKKSYSADYQDLVAQFFMSDVEAKLTFLELGAVDGIYKSNCALLEKNGWTGIAVEANPVFADDFHRNRRCEFINKGVVTPNQITKDVRLEYLPDAVTSGKLTSSKSKSNHETIQCDLISVQQLMSHWESQFGDAPTYLSVDIEGSDLPVVREMCTNGFKPTLISMEHNFRAGEIAEIESMASEFGYIQLYEKLCRNEVILALRSAHSPSIASEIKTMTD